MFRFKLGMKIFLVGVLVACLFIIARPNSVSAGTDSIPDSADFGGASVRLIVGNPSGWLGINSPTSIVKIYSPSPTINVTIYGFDQCGDGYDYLNPGQTRYEIFATNANEANTGNRLSFRDNGTGCGGWDTQTITATHPGPRSVLIGHTSYYVYEFRASLLGGSFGWNGFSLNVPGAFVGYSESSGDKFAIKSSFVAGDASVATYADYTIRFGVACEITTAQQRNLSWFDADQGQPNQARTISFDLIDDTTGSTIVSTNNVGSQAEARTLTVTFQPGHKYRWVWRDVSSHNGIQMQIPFDSIYYNTICVPPPPAPTVACNAVSINPAVPEAGQTFTSTVNIGNSPSTAVTYTGGTASLTVSPSPTSGNPQSGIAVPAISGGSSVNVTSGSIVANASGVYTIDWNVSGGNAGSVSCPGTLSFNVVTKPYLHIYGGDVQAGSGFGESCSAFNGSAEILTFNRGSGDSFQGAGTHMAAFALGEINGFASNNGGVSAKSLSFSNVAGNFVYGGNFGQTYCAADYWADAPTSPAPPNSLTIAGANIANSIHPAIYVDGDATITNNIVYTGDGTWADLSQIPSYYLIVKGNIYIHKSVTRLDGVYVAMPDSGGNRGIIYTCTNGSTPYGNAGSFTASECTNQLTINGAFIARQVKFLRTIGTISQATAGDTVTAPHIAEIFVYGPEIWVR